MSQQYAFPPPPPRPASRERFFDPPRRRTGTAVQPPSISTNFLRTQGVGASSQAPGPGLGQATPFPYSPATPVALNPRTPGPLELASQASSQRVPPPPPSPQSQVASPLVPAPPPGTPNMAQPYNPRQWSQGGSQMGALAYQQQRASVMPSGTRGVTGGVTGMEAAMPSPPPPYSPETPDSAPHQAIRPSPMLDQVGFVASPLPADSASARGSPQVPMSPRFPPPPGPSSRHRERSASGQAGQRFFYGLANLTGRGSSTSRGKQPVTHDLQASQSVFLPQEAEQSTPPAARRAASTGQMQSGSSGVHQSSMLAAVGRSSPDNSGWQPGMPLPGPPPGPPPPGARSQSLNRCTASFSRTNSQTSEEGADGAQPPRRAAAVTSTLGSVPPTPADWVPETPRVQQHPQALRSHPPDTGMQALRIDTSAHRDGSLSRRPAKRGVSAQGIRERRSRSRAAKEGSKDGIMSPASDDSRPSDLIFSPSSGSINQRREHTRKISSEVVPIADSSSREKASPTNQATPADHASAIVLTPPYTPAVGKKSEESVRKRALPVPSSALSDRPISHILHAPNEDSSTMPKPLIPTRPPSSSSMRSATKLEPFFLQATERHRSYIEKEAAATSDEERLELFTNYMVHESRLRRDRYHAAYNAMAGDIVDLTRDMWRSYTRTSKRAATPSTSMSSFDPTVPSWASDGQPASAHGCVPSSASSVGDFTPATDVDSIGDLGEAAEAIESRKWTETFKPSLSPIPSMAVSTAQDDSSDSRGRTASRWWEKSDSGSIGRPDRMERSHRETKYMGINPATLQEPSQASPGLPRQTPTPEASRASFVYGSNEYPPEKVGCHESSDFDTPMQSARQASTPGLDGLDVSRLVTLPPPYPRHHPAVNNSHPLLSNVRDEHRYLADHSEIQKIKDDYLEQDWAVQRSQQEDAKQRRAKLRSSVQAKVMDGSISFQQAAQAEADFDIEEAERGKSNARANFDIFEASVSHPLNTLTERLTRANACMGALRAELESHNEASDPNQTQEEGDEHPERLERLTLLKWLFEAREQLHKEMFDLHAQRSEKYSEVILTPYRLAKAQSKLDEANSFFARDSRERQLTFAKDSLKRYEELQQVVEQNVTRGVEGQLSAFWDIAPGLLEVIQQISPEKEIQVPQRECEENASYRKHPAQYLYSVLAHAEKSARQFIDAQVNLLCLLHEVRTATTKSRLRLLEIERAAVAGATTPTSASSRSKTSSVVNVDAELKAEMLQARRLEEDRLTADLQEKVGEVEGQWREALGEGIEECKRRVRWWLEESGGWEEGLEG